MNINSFLLHAPQRKKFKKDEWLKQSAHIPSTSALPAHTAPMAIASALQGYIAAMNVTRFILLVLKTIIHHHAKFRRKMRPKNDPSIITHTSENSKISVTMLYSLESSFKHLSFDPRFSFIFHLVMEIQGVKHMLNSVKYPVK